MFSKFIILWKNTHFKFVMSKYGTGVKKIWVTGGDVPYGRKL